MSRAQPFIMVWWKLLMGHLWWLSKTKTPHCVEVWSSSNVPNSPPCHVPACPHFLNTCASPTPPAPSLVLLFISTTLWFTTYNISAHCSLS
jgi:hypothetical protein